MSNHDPLCLFHAHPDFPPRFCDCERVAVIRADTRKQVAAEIKAGCVHGRGILTAPTAPCYRCAHAATIARGRP